MVEVNADGHIEINLGRIRRALGAWEDQTCSGGVVSGHTVRQGIDQS